MRALIGIAAISLILVTAGAREGVGGAQNPILPEGPGKAILETACSKCHTLERVVVKHKDTASWQRTIDKMRTRLNGAQISNDDARIVLNYLSSNYGRNSASAITDGSQLLAAKCTSCHNVMKIERQALTKEDWKALVDGMSGLGADVTDDEIRILVDYLFLKYPKR